MHLQLYKFFLTNFKAEVFSGEANNKGLNHYGKISENGFY